MAGWWGLLQKAVYTYGGESLGGGEVNLAAGGQDHVLQIKRPKGGIASLSAASKGVTTRCRTPSGAMRRACHRLADNRKVHLCGQVPSYHCVQ